MRPRDDAYEVLVEPLNLNRKQTARSSDLAFFLGALYVDGRFAVELGLSGDEDAVS